MLVMLDLLLITYICDGASLGVKRDKKRWRKIGYTDYNLHHIRWYTVNMEVLTVLFLKSQDCLVEKLLKKPTGSVIVVSQTRSYCTTRFLLCGLHQVSMVCRLADTFNLRFTHALRERRTLWHRPGKTVYAVRKKYI